MSELTDLKGDVQGKKGDARRNTVIAVGTILLVVIAYFTLRKLSTPIAAGSDVTGTASDIGTDGTTADTSINAVTNQLSAENGYLAAILAAVTPPVKKAGTVIRKSKITFTPAKPKKKLPKITVTAPPPPPKHKPKHKPPGSAPPGKPVPKKHPARAGGQHH